MNTREFLIKQLYVSNNRNKSTYITEYQKVSVLKKKNK